MILLITPSGRAGECSAEVARALHEEVVSCRSLGAARRLGRTRQAHCVILDQLVADAAGDNFERYLGEIPAAPIVLVNLAISSPQRVVTQVRTALRRAAHEREAMHRSVVGEFRSDLNSTVTGILLASQLALNAPGLPEAAEEKLRSVYRLAKDLREHLRP